MKKEIFEQLSNEILSCINVKVSLMLLEDQTAKKWYDKTFTSNFEDITTETNYGVFINGYCYFEFKTTKKEETFFKSFLNTFCRKYTYSVMEDGFIVEKKPTEIMDVLKAKNSDRVFKGMFYTTLYGIGIFSLFLSDKAIENLKNTLGSYLKESGIDYRNEYSEAGWVYRFVINKEVSIHNKLLENYKIN